VCCAFALMGAAFPMLSDGQPRGARPAQPPLIRSEACPRDALALPADAVAAASRVALTTERSDDRPRIIAAGLADHGAPREEMVLASCGRHIWHRTVAVAIDLRRHHPSASLSERVSFVARTRSGYAVFAIGH